MNFYNVNYFKLGLKILYENFPYIIESVNFVKPGKGQSFARVKLRNLINNKLIEKTFKSTEKLKKANILNFSAKYLYNDTKFWYFLNTKNFEEFYVEKKIIKNNIYWLINQGKCSITLWNSKVISVIPENFVILKVISSDLNTKKDSINKNLKLVKLSTGVSIKVPYFIKIGDFIKVDTRTCKYICRI
ncbi:elongation factor P [Buchnera aphidicola]|uniref:elongation factor P n=1 Tax=Buchnera aphidicola TaxID=9 RepID=UPI0030EC5CD2